jgi:hypothetical protein
MQTQNIYISIPSLTFIIGCYISLQNYTKAKELFDTIPNLIDRRKINGKELPTEVLIKKKREASISISNIWYISLHSSNKSNFIEKNRDGEGASKLNMWKPSRSAQRMVCFFMFSLHVHHLYLPFPEIAICKS